VLKQISHFFEIKRNPAEGVSYLQQR